LRCDDVKTVARYQLSDLLFESDAQLPELRQAPADLADDVELRVNWRSARPRAAVATAPFASWLTAEGEPWLTFAAVDGQFLLTFPEHGQFTVARDGSRVDVEPFTGTPPDTMRHLFLHQILPLVLSRRGRLVLHAGAVSYHDRVVAFIGRSGGGKSTLAVACARAGASLVCDDCLVVNRHGDRWTTLPYHAGIRLWPEALALLGLPEETGVQASHYSDKRRLDEGAQLAHETRELPLAAILYLPSRSAAESPASTLGPSAPPQVLRGRDAVLALASEVFRLDSRDPDESRRQFDALGAMAAAIPVEIPRREAPDEAARALLCRMAEGWRLL